jgi:hypothetical protein
MHEAHMAHHYQGADDAHMSERGAHMAVRHQGIIEKKFGSFPAV